MHEAPVVLDKREARQATRDRLNLRVLVVSTVAAIVIVGLLYAFFAAGPVAP